MDPTRLVLGIARAALGGGKKKAGKARGFLSYSGLLTPASLLGTGKRLGAGLGRLFTGG